MGKYSSEFNNAHILLGLCTLFFSCCITCSNVNKSMVNEKIQNISAEEIKIELDLIKDCLRDFINPNNKNEVYLNYNITLNSLQKPPSKLETGEWKIDKWFIDKVGGRKPIAKYFSPYGLDSLTLEVFLSKQRDGTYKVIDWHAVIDMAELD